MMNPGSPALTVGSITGITNSIAVHVLSTGGTLAVQNLTTGTVAVNAKDGTFAVYFSPSEPSFNTVNRVTNVVDGTISTLGTLDYVTRVRNLVDGTITTVAAVTNITNSIAAHIISTGGTMAVDIGRFRETISIAAKNGTFAVYFSPANPAIGSITSSIAAHIISTNGTMAVDIGRFRETISITAKDGTMAVRFSPARPVVLADAESTVSIFTVTGSTSGGTTSGVTLVAPSASYNFKVFAFSLQTTALASSVWRFTNGGGSETELWRGLATEATTTSVAKGSNMAVAPPGFIFATGTSTTLALKSDTGSLVHYSVSYRKESA